MQNSVANVNSGETPNSCTISHIQYWEDVTHIYEIDNDGEPVYETEHTDGDFRCYYCENCGEEFKTFELAKEHCNE